MNVAKAFESNNEKRLCIGEMMVWSLTSNKYCPNQGGMVMLKSRYYIYIPHALSEEKKVVGTRGDYIEPE